MDFFIAGSRTTSTTLDYIFLMMLLYPDVQRRAQAELDAVVGRGRLPQLADRKK
jgi:cytochrome P450